MRDINTNFSDHLNQDVTTLCHAWRVTRIDGRVLGFTDHDHPLSFDGTSFLPESGFLPSAVRSELGLNIDDGEVAGAFSTDAVSEKDLSDGRYDGAKVEVFLVNWNAPDTALKLRTQEIGEVSFGANVFQAELRSIAHKLEQPQGRTYSQKCSANLGDSACSIDLNTASFKGQGRVQSVLDDSACVVTGLAGFEPFWFRHGLITWTGGTNNGLSVEVYDHSKTDGEVLLRFFSPFPNTPETGDQFTITAGCTKSFATCRNKFSNHLNFRGFPHLPGRDFAYGYADEETVHDGRPLVG